MRSKKVLGFILLTTFMVLLLSSCGALSAAAKLEEYEIGGETVKTVNSVVGERTVTGVETSTTNGVPQKQYTYESDSVFDDLLAYTQYLQNNDWIVSQDYDLSVTPGTAQLAKNSSEDGKVLVLAVAYEGDKYAIKLTKTEGTINMN